jgi:hypothetical protein
MKTPLYLTAASVLFLASCKKDNNDNTDVVTPPTTANHTKYMYPLAVGNYWVYGEIIIDSNGIQTPTSTIDSVYIDKDTVINGATYYRLFFKDIYNGSGSYSYYRDSAGYRVSLNGIVNPLAGNVGDTISSYVDPMNYYLNYNMVAQPPASITLPSGTFTNLFAIRNDYYLNPPFNAAYNPLENYRYSSATVGLLSYQFNFTSAPWITYERRLIRYKLN